jgi:hypothetical protein
MQKVLECMVAIEKQISLLCEEKLTVERLLRDQLELQQDIADKLFGQKLEIKDILSSAYREDKELTVVFTSEDNTDEFNQLLKKYHNNRPQALLGKIRSLDVKIQDLCEAWQTLDDYRDMGFIDLGEKTANDFVDRMMQYIDNIG